MCYKSLPPNVSFLYGLLNAEYAPKEREKVQRCKKVQEEEEEEQPEDGASKIEQQGEESLDVKGTLCMTISQVKALVDESKDTKGQIASHRYRGNRRRNKRSRTEITDHTTAEETNAEANVEESGDNNKNVQVYIKRSVATVVGLFTKGRQNITVDGISYSCGIPIEKKCNKKTIQYMKVYRCLMVHNKKHKRGGGKIGKA
jgi:hypothetical protein